MLKTTTKEPKKKKKEETDEDQCKGWVGSLSEKPSPLTCRYVLQSIFSDAHPLYLEGA